MKRERFVLIAIVSIVSIVLAAHGGVLALSGASPAGSTIEWVHLSSATGDLPPPSNATQQTASLILDVDKDGLNDFVIGSRRAGPAMVWYQRDSDGWTKYLVDDATLDIEAGGAYYDIDRDGDLDVVMGGDARSNKMWWWENPYPSYEPDTPWTRREIKNSGSNKHHDRRYSRGVPASSRGWPRRMSMRMGRWTLWVVVAGSSITVARATHPTSLMTARHSREPEQAN
jgi:hypothetical protein